MDLAEHVEAVLRTRLGATHVEVIDESHLHRGHAGARGGGRHLRVTVVSPAFEGKILLARHRMVNALFADEMRSAIHALALVTKTPDEWSRGS